MLSALQANLLAASRIALAMARDRTLPHWLETVHPRRGTPVAAVLATAAIVVCVLLVVPNLAAIGAAASLVFLITFALAHRINMLARRRGSRDRPHFRTPWFPVLPIVGALACAALALFQGISVPAAGIIAGVWLAAGGVLYAALFARRARALDAYAQALDVELVALRGRSPLVLVPIVNPSNAVPMVDVATASTPPGFGRVLLLSVVSSPAGWDSDETPPALEVSLAVIRGALTASFARGLAPEALTTVAADPWARDRPRGPVAPLREPASRPQQPGRARARASSGKPDGTGAVRHRNPSRAARMAAPQRAAGACPAWRTRRSRRTAGASAGQHPPCSAPEQITLLRVVASTATDRERQRATAELRRVARDEVPGEAEIVVVADDDPAGVVAQRAGHADLVILGLRHAGQRRRVFGDLALRIARETQSGIIMITRRG